MRTGEIDGAVVVFHDLTRIKQLEVVRRDFVANVSHELRTPLAIFRGYLETLIDNPGLPREDTAARARCRCSAIPTGSTRWWRTCSR